MMRVTVLICLLLPTLPAAAQDRKPADIKPLTAQDCAKITRRPQGDFVVSGEITIGDITIADSNISKNGFVMNGADNYEVVQRSCFNGKSL